jgi:septal ring factor EnvC (AmiA/AmiB activator)
MTLFIFIIVAIALSSIASPIAKGYARRLANSAPTPEALRRLQTELEQAEQRIADAERRLQQAEHRLDFQEKLLSAPSSADRESGREG